MIDRYKLVWGFDQITEGFEYFVTAELAYEYAYKLGCATGITWAYDSVQGLKEHGEYAFAGDWIRLEQHQSPYTNPLAPTQEMMQQR